MSAPPNRAIAGFIEEARRIVSKEGVTPATLRSIGEKMALLAGIPDIVSDPDLAKLHDSDSRATVIHTDGNEGLTLMLARQSEKARTPVHDHDSWGIACVLKGRDHYIQWERLDDGSDPSHAKLRIQYERELSPGEFVYWHGPPRDIHSQQGMGAPVWELVLFGKNAAKTKRHYFDPIEGTVTVKVAMPQ